MVDPSPRPPDADPAARPGVPMEADPEPDPGAHWSEPPRQDVSVTVLHRSSIRELTPVVGTGQPPRWLSGRLRSAAYAIPEHEARHWALLLAADRVDVVEHRLEALARLDLDEYRRLASSRALLGVAGAIVTVLLVRRLLR